MKGKKLLAALALGCLLAVPGALAGSLPEDVPVAYGKPQMDDSQVEAPELDDSAVDEGTAPAAQAPQSAGTIRPGDRAKENSFTVQTVSQIVFNSPYEAAVVNATNPEGSTVITQYQLRVSIAELQRQTGRTGYTKDQLAALEATQGFNPEASYITLAETKGIAPGAMVQTMMLSPLPDGTMLSAGDYQAEMVVTAYDVETNKRSLVGGVVKVPFHILNDQMQIAFDADGLGAWNLYNPEATGADVAYSILISQQAVIDGCGEPHQTAEALAAQQANAQFDPAYEFLTIYESEAVAPGSFLDGNVQLDPLPDGQMLPTGEYAAWLVRSVWNAAGGYWEMLDARTELVLQIGAKAGGVG